MRVAVDLADGAKVISLRCKRHGREWLAQPSADAPPSADGAFGAAQSWGWDELFPTVLPGAGAPRPWSAPLRDHGELWGRPWELVEHAPARLVARYIDPDGRFAFTRGLGVAGDRLRVAYAVANRTAARMPFLWAMHPILALAPGERIGLPGVEAVAATHVEHALLRHRRRLLQWPVARATDGTPVALDTVAEHDGTTALKLYARTAGAACAAVEGGSCRLTVRALPGGPVRAIGLYLNYGGWPQPGSPLHQVGIEPTTAAADDLLCAIEGSAPAVVAPHGELAWALEVALDSVEP